MGKMKSAIITLGVIQRKGAESWGLKTLHCIVVKDFTWFFESFNIIFHTF